MTIKHCLGEFINQLQKSISSSKVSSASDFQQWVNQEKNQDFKWCPFPPPHGENHRPGFGTDLSSVPQGLCFVFREFGRFGTLFFSKSVELLTLARKPPSSDKDICKYDGASHRRNWEKCNPRNYCKQVKLVLRDWSIYFPWTTK